jgi:lipopolysaccharide export system permease protein
VSQASAAGIRRGPPAASGVVSRYMLRLLAKPLAATLLLVLPALLMERLLRLFDLLANAGTPAGSIVQLLLYLVPHYLGLAVPAALFLAVYVVVARLSQDHEMDALQATGFSLARLSWPFLAVGVLCAGLSLGLYGYVQPLSRYAYRAAFHTITNAGWNATLVPGEFVRVGRRLTVYVDRRDATDGLLHGVFLHQLREDGAEILTTAATGRLLVSSEESELLMELEEGQQVTTLANGESSTLAFTNSAQSRPFIRRLPLFRLRGTDEREMTLGELWAARDQPEPPVPLPRLDGELHGRLVRSASLLFLPLLAMPMGLAAKRSRRSAGILLGAVILVVYQQALQLMESLGDVGRIDSRPALWLLFLLFAAFGILVFRHSNLHPEEGAFDGVLAWLDRGVARVASWLPRRLRPAA